MQRSLFLILTVLGVSVSILFLRLAQNQTVTPVVLAVQSPLVSGEGDLIVGDRNFAEVKLRLLSAETRESIQGVMLSLRRLGLSASPEPDVSKALQVTTDSFGEASVSIPTSGGKEDRWEVVLAESPRLRLASPWRSKSSGTPCAVFDVLVAQEGTRFLLVELDAQAVQESRRFGNLIGSLAVSESLKESVERKSYDCDRILYVIHGRSQNLQPIKRWLASCGLPPGLLRLLPEDLAKDRGYEQLELYLKKMGCRVLRDKAVGEVGL